MARACILWAFLFAGAISPFSGVTFFLCFVLFRFSLFVGLLNPRPFVQPFFGINVSHKSQVVIEVVNNCLTPLFLFIFVSWEVTHLLVLDYAPLPFHFCMEKSTLYVFLPDDVFTL